jgi:hypothetical protein
MMAWHPREAPDLGGTPSEEDVSEADAARRVDADPEEQLNFTEKKERGLERQEPVTDGSASDDS